jgi:dihydropteroate synthase
MKLSVNCNGKILNLTKPVVMGIVNLTPDSFYKFSRYNTLPSTLKAIEDMIKEGASIIDLGAYSSRPGAEDITEEEELMRLAPVLNAAISAFPEVIFSVDTFRAKVASESINLGVGIINDISGGRHDEQLAKVVSEKRVCYILMHSKGSAQNMNSLTQYDDLLIDVLNYFKQKISTLSAIGIKDIIIDPGFGFAKTISQNFSLLNELHCLGIFGHPILVGLSRKSMIYKSLEGSAETALNGTTALHMKALIEGAKVLRVHDVKEAFETIKLYELLASSA